MALAAILFAISGACAKALFNAGVTAYQLIQLRTTLAFVGLIVWLAIRYPGQLKISLSDIPYFICLGFFGIGAAQFFYLFAISKINVAAAILLHYTGPVFVALYTALVQRQRIGKKALAAILGTLVGSYLVVGAYRLGRLCCMVCCLRPSCGMYGFRPWEPFVKAIRPSSGFGYCLSVWVERLCPLAYILKVSKGLNQPMPALPLRSNPLLPGLLPPFF